MPKHFLSINDLSKEKIEGLLDEAELIELYWDHRDKLIDPVKNKCISTFFAEPSTRTRFSFERAAHWLGIQVISAADASVSSSLKKGESLKDTFRTLGQYSDVIVTRMGSENWPDIAREHSRVPVINAGSGSGEHPTQALLDIHTIRQKFGNPNGLKIMICGDLMYGRTARSLVQLLKLYDCEIILCPAINVKAHGHVDMWLSHTTLNFPKEELEGFKVINWEEGNDYLPEIDVLYMTRCQKERFESGRIDLFKLNKNNIGLIKKDAIILHPLPRNEEISEEIDEDPRAAYHEKQVKNGVYVRTSLLHKMIKGIL